jgi:anti-sigma factor RsiW
MSHDPHDLLAAYALDALDDDERERFERHLEECEECSEQLALLREPVAALAYAAEGPAPPEALRGRIIEGARAEPRAAVIRLRRRNWPLAALAGVAAAAACLAIGLGIWANSLSNSLDQE